MLVVLGELWFTRLCGYLILVPSLSLAMGHTEAPGERIGVTQGKIMFWGCYVIRLI